MKCQQPGCTGTILDGYCDVCATDVLSFVASIFARGHVKK